MAEVNDAATIAKDQLSEVVNKLEPQEAVNVVLIDEDGIEYTYTQKKLTFINKLVFFSILGNAIDKATSENNGMSIQTITQGSEGLLSLITKVLRYIPSLIEDIFCLSLSVTPEEKPFVVSLLKTINDEEGTKMLSVFIDQNAEDIKDFFTKRLQPIVRQLGTTFGSLKETVEAGDKASSKPSRPTRRATQKK